MQQDMMNAILRQEMWNVWMNCINETWDIIIQGISIFKNLFEEW